MLGLKLWSCNYNQFAEAVAEYQNNKFDFLELYIVPETFDEEKFKILKKLPVNIHAPNEHLFNLMEEKEANFTIFKEVVQFANFFDAEYIIIHPGVGTNQEIFFKNMEKIEDPRIIIENVPCKGLRTDLPLFGCNFVQLKEILERTRKGFCLDFTHAIKSAKTQEINYKEFLNQLKQLKPKVFHLSDGDQEIEMDQHLNLGEGNFDLKFIKEIIGESKVVLETPKMNNNLKNDLNNITFLKAI